MPTPERRTAFATAFAVFVAALAIYGVSVPASFNTVYENRRFFDSDGEFITRQYRQGRTFTHNDHLLYHVLGRVLSEAGSGEPDPVRGHRALSVVSGAAGLAIAFLGGWAHLRRVGPSLAATALLGGTAGYWFFSATIDTYVPSVAMGLVALGLALSCLREPGVVRHALLGAAGGAAFLLRSDGALLAVLGAVVLARPERRRTRVAAATTAGIVVGLLGYAVIAHLAYEVAWADVPGWALGHEARPETGDRWGRRGNWTGANLAGVAVNQAVYTILLPGLETTGDRSIGEATRHLGPWRASLVAWGVFALVVGATLVRRSISAIGQRRWELPIALGIGVAWFVTRMLVYAWWDPYDPFLFAVMSTPLAWLAAVLFLVETDPERPSRARPAAVWGMAAVIWLHNGVHLVMPLRQL